VALLPLKILHINTNLGTVGGTESYIRTIIGDLAQRGHESEVASEQDLSDGAIAPWHPLPEIFTPGKRWGLRHGWRLARILWRAKPDLVHLHNTMNPDLVSIVGRLCPAVRYVHDHTLFCPGLNKVHWDGALCDRAMGDFCLEKHRDGGCFCFQYPTEKQAEGVLRQSQRLLATHDVLKRVMVASSYMLEELRAVGMPSEKIVLNPYYTEEPADSAAPEAPPAEPPLILVLCRIVHPDKGILPLLEALARIEAPFQAKIVGSGPHLDQMLTRLEELKLGDRVEFPGFLENAQAMKLIRSARVIAFPSMWQEPFGLVGIEAMMRSRPVVAFDVGGVGEWLEAGRTGKLVPRGDTEGFARALSEYLLDPALASAHGVAGRASVKDRFLRDRHLDVLEEVYRDALS